MQVVRKIEGLRVGNQDKPVERIFISDCGQLRAGAAVPPEEEDEEEDEEAKARRLQQEKVRRSVLSLFADLLFSSSRVLSSIMPALLPACSPPSQHHQC